MTNTELIRSRIQKIVEARKQMHDEDWDNQALRLETVEWLTTFALEALEALEGYSVLDGTDGRDARTVIDRAAGKG